MFSITCRTCAAKLKVKNPAAIGQRLACPKCGEMVEVQPPPGWTPPESPDASQSAVVGDFEDIDQLIGGKSPTAAGPSKKIAPTAAPPTSRPASGSPGDKSKPNTRAAVKNRELDPLPTEKAPGGRPPGELPATGATPISVPEKPLLQPRTDTFDLTQPREYLPDPNLPPPDWTKPGNSRSRAILVSSLLLIGFLGVIAAIITLLNQTDSAKGDKQVAQAKPTEPKPEASANPAAPAEPTPQHVPDTGKENPPRGRGDFPITEQGSNPEAAEPQAAPLSQTDHAAGKTVLEQSAPKSDTGTTELEKEMPEKSPPAPENTAKESSGTLPGREERPVSPVIPDTSPLGSQPTESAATQTGEAAAAPPTGPTTLTDRLGKLSQLLSGPGTTLTELGDLAQSERTDRLVGLPRYLISQPTLEPPIGDPWSIPVAEIVYKDVPLHLFIGEFSALTGVPMSIDALALAQSGIAIDSPVSIEIENATTGEILATVLKERRLERVNLAGVEVILPFGSQTASSTRFPLPKIKDPSPEKFQAMADSLTKLVDPVSWTLDTGKRKIVVDGEELVVSNTSTAAAQIGEFLGKLNAAIQIQANQADEAANKQLTSRAFRAQVGLQKVLELEPTLDQPLEEFLQRVYRQTGVAITVDWAALAAAGWSNRSEVPGDFQAATVEQLLKELARSLSATWLAIDENTFQLTSFQEASRRVMLEIYPLQGLALEPQPLLDILNQTLGSQLRENPAVQYLYVPEIHALVVSAPQPLQRQFEAIVNRLKQPKK